MVTLIATNLYRVFNDTRLNKAKLYSLQSDPLNNRVIVYGTYNRTSQESEEFPIAEFKRDGAYYVFTKNKTIKLILKHV